MPEPRVTMSVYLDPELFFRIRAYAFDQHRTVSAMAALLLKEALDLHFVPDDVTQETPA